MERFRRAVRRIMCLVRMSDKGEEVKGKGLARGGNLCGPYKRWLKIELGWGRGVGADWMVRISTHWWLAVCFVAVCELERLAERSLVWHRKEFLNFCGSADL